jgi:hypothetical protein
MLQVLEQRPVDCRRPIPSGVPINRGGPSVQALLALQRRAGNGAVHEMLATGEGVAVQRCGGEAHPGCACAEAEDRAVQRDWWEDVTSDVGAAVSGVEQALTAAVDGPSQEAPRDGAASSLGPQEAPPGEAASSLPSATNSAGVSTSSDPIRRILVYAAGKGMAGPWLEALQCAARLLMGNPAIAAVYEFLKLADMLIEWQNSRGANPGQDFFKGVFDVYCDCLAPLWRIYWQKVLEPFTNASDAYTHYLKGGGADLHYDVGLLLSDPGLRVALRRAVLSGAEEGDVPVGQRTWNSCDLFYTFGGVDSFRFRRVDPLPAPQEGGGEPEGARVRVQVELADPYQWHPDEFARIAPCLHTASEDAKLEGAQEYMQRAIGEYDLDLARELEPGQNCPDIRIALQGAGRL